MSYTARTVNTVLLVTIIAVNAYILCAPLMPLALFWTGKHLTHQTERIHEQLSLPLLDTRTASTVLPDNRLLIPAMQLNAVIHEGRDARALRDGPWHRQPTIVSRSIPAPPLWNPKDRLVVVATLKENP